MSQNCSLDRQCQVDHFCDQRQCKKVTHGSPCPQHSNSLCPVGYFFDGHRHRCFSLDIKTRLLKDSVCHDSTDCPASHYCEPKSKQCVILRHEDEHCSSDLECERNFLCLPKTLTCAAPCDSAHGLDCTGDKLCDTSSFHGFGYCVPSGYAAMQPASAIAASSGTGKTDSMPLLEPTPEQDGPQNQSWKWYVVFLVVLGILLLLLFLLLFLYFYIRRKRHAGNHFISPAKESGNRPESRTHPQASQPWSSQTRALEKTESKSHQSDHSDNTDADRESGMPLSTVCSSLHPSRPDATGIQIPSPYIPYMQPESH